MFRTPLASYFIFVLLFYVFSGLNLHAQVVTEWEKTMGGSDDDRATSIAQTMDGGYVVTGFSKSTSGDITGNHGGFDFWVAKLAMNGQLDWQQNFGGYGKDQAAAVKECEDGSYIIAGTTLSKDGNAVRDDGKSSTKADFLVIKVNQFGDLLWQKKLGGSLDETANDLALGKDGSVYVVGTALSGDVDLNKNHGEEDAWIVKLDSKGKLIWQKAIGGKLKDEARSVKATPDGGCIVVGGSQSSDGDIQKNKGGEDLVAIKFNASGSVEWAKNFGGKKDERAEEVGISPDGNYVIAGYSSSNDGDLSKNAGAKDVWVLKVSKKGELIWQNSLGGSKNDVAESINIVPNVGFVIAGTTNSNDGDVDKNKGASDLWVIKLDQKGKKIWEKNLGGSSQDVGMSVAQTFDAGYIVAGFSNSSDQDVSETKGFWDYWILKLKEVPPRITAVCYEDANLNGKFEQSETLLHDQVLLLRPKAFYSFADDYGNSIFYVEPGTYKLECVPKKGWELASDSLEYSITVEEDADIIRYFGFMPEGRIKPDVIPEKIEAEKPTEIDIAPPVAVLEKKEIVEHKTLRKSSDIECGKILELSKLTFKPNTSAFTREKDAKEYLELLVDYMKDNPGSSIQVYGHTDFLSKNKDWLHELSEQRVERVKEMLTKKGIDEDRIKTKAFGGTLPIVKEREDPNRSKNRRVEVEINCN